MGLLDFLLGGKPASTVELMGDRIWMSQQAKFNGIQKELEVRANSDSVAVLLVAHFADSLDRLNGIAADYTGDMPAARVDRLFRIVYARQPDERETQWCEAFVGHARPSPWTNLAQALLMSNEFIYVD